MRFIAVDLFCGGGGTTHGLIQSGFEVVLAVDCWEEALRIHELNHPNVKCLKFELGGDVKEFASLVRSFLPVDEDFHFHLHGSPPCQAISNASHNLEKEDGMYLVNWFFDLVEELNPDSWTMENVVPVDQLLPKHIDRVKINAADFGVPQRRERIFAFHGINPVRTHRTNQWVKTSDVLPRIEAENDGKIEIVARRVSGERNDSKYRIDQPALTITSLPHVIEVNGKTTGSLKVYEGATLQGWPDMVLDDTMKREDLWKIVGNMVCPPVARAIGISIIKAKKEGLRFTKQKKL